MLTRRIPTDTTTTSRQAGNRHVRMGGGHPIPGRLLACWPGFVATSWLPYLPASLPTCGWPYRGRAPGSATSCCWWWTCCSCLVPGLWTARGSWPTRRAGEEARPDGGPAGTHGRQAGRQRQVVEPRLDTQQQQLTACTTSRAPCCCAASVLACCLPLRWRVGRRPGAGRSTRASDDEPRPPRDCPAPPPPPSS